MEENSARICEKCYADLIEKGDYLWCRYCKSTYTKNRWVYLKKATDETNYKKIIILKQRLIDKVNEPLRNSTKIIGISNQILNYLPNDIYAKFYEVANSSQDSEIIRFMQTNDFDNNEAEAIVEWLIDSISEKIYQPLKNFTNKYIKDEDKLEHYQKRIEEEYNKVKNEVYNTSLSRDVFLLYSPEDLDYAKDIVYEIEKKFTCFAPYKNMRNGKNAFENYEEYLKEALNNCKCIVFLSSKNSMVMDYEMIERQLSYIKNSVKRIGRIEYLIDNERNKIPENKKKIFDDVFVGKYCDNKDDLLDKIGKEIEIFKQNLSPEEELELVKGQLKEAKIKNTFLEKNSKSADSVKYENNDFEFEFVDDYIVINGIKNRDIDNLTIPNIIDGCAVKIISDSAFKNCKRLKNVTIFNGVKIIGVEAFANCTELVNIELPNSITKIGKDAFKNCDKLKYNQYNNGCYLGNKKNLYIALIQVTDKKITSCIVNRDTKVIYNSTFENCRELKNIVIESISRLISIGDYAFSNCVNLRNIILPDTLKNIGNYVFNYCNNLNSITISSNIINIGNSIFCDCDNLMKVYYKGSVEDWGNLISRYSCFIEKAKYFYILENGKYRQIEELVIPSTVETIEKYSFRGIRNIKKIVIKNGVKAIGRGAFANCKNLEKIVIPGSVETIDEKAFIDCENLKEVIIYDGLKNIGYMAFCGCVSIEKIIIPNTVRTIGKSAFKDCTNLTEIELSNSMTTIAFFTFCNCINLKYIRLPGSIFRIENSAFLGCRDLTIEFSKDKTQSEEKIIEFENGWKSGSVLKIKINN